MKYLFDNPTEWKQAFENLKSYHDCEKCHGKIVFIGQDKLGNSICGYCKEIVKYPRMEREAFKKWLKSI